MFGWKQGEISDSSQLLTLPAGTPTQVVKGTEVPGPQHSCGAQLPKNAQTPTAPRSSWEPPSICRARTESTRL